MFWVFEFTRYLYVPFFKKCQLCLQSLFHNPPNRAFEVGEQGWALASAGHVSSSPMGSPPPALSFSSDTCAHCNPHGRAWCPQELLFHGEQALFNCGLGVGASFRAWFFCPVPMSHATPPGLPGSGGEDLHPLLPSESLLLFCLHANPSFPPCATWLSTTPRCPSDILEAQVVSSVLELAISLGT